MVIDFHTHIFPDKIAERTIKALEQNILDIQGVSSYAYLDGTLSGLKKSMKINNIDYSVVMPIATKVTQSTTINNFAQSINGKDNIFSFGSVHPLQSNAMEELERVKELGLLGIKLHPEYQNFYIDSDESMRVLKKAEQLGLFVVLHTGKDIGIKPPVHCSPDRLRIAVEKLGKGGANIIAAHMGGWREWDMVYDYLAGSEVMLDTSYSIPMMGQDLFEKIFAKHGADKILFGTDSPWQSQGESVENIKKLGLSDIDCNKILSGNAVNLLGLNN